MEPKLSERRRQEILEHLRLEREKRREFIQRSEQESGESMLSQAKQNLREILLEEREARGSVKTEPVSTPKPTKRKVRANSSSSHRKIQPSSIYTECTFKPEINPPSTKYKDKWEDFEQRLDEISQPKTEVLKKRELQRQNAENQVYQQHCTFRPSITEYQMKHLPTFDEPVEDRLIRMGEEKRLIQNRLIKEKENNEVGKYSFHPDISAYTEKPPIHKRINELQKQKSEEREKLRIEQEKTQDLTFKPYVSPYSQMLAEQKKSKPIEKTQTRKEDINTFTFAPQPRVNFNEFLARQEAFVKEKEENCQQQIARQKDPCTFKPDINEVSKKIAEKLYDEEPHQRLERLTHFDKEKIEKERSKKTEEYYKKFTYTPKINKISQSLGKPSSLTQLVYDKEAQLARELKAEEFLMQEQHLCSFQPQINKEFSHIQSEYSNRVDIMKNIECGELKKKMFTENLKAKEEEKLKKNCTFNPQTNPKTPTKNGVVPVAGLNRFLEVRDMAKKKSDRQKDREEQVFGLKNTGKWNHCFTVPEPFQLTSWNKEEKVAKMHVEKQEKEMKECTFKPRTLES